MTLVDALLVFSGFATAALSGVAGMGGGTILIALFFAFGLAPIEAVPLFAAVQLVSNSARTVAYARHVEWRATGWFLLTAVPVTLLVAPWVALVEPALIQLILAGLILASLRPGAAALPLGARRSFALAGALNGSIGLFVGATGLFVGRLFLRPEWRKETVIGTLALTQVLGHGLRVIAFGLVGFSIFSRPLLLAALCLAVVAGTVLGKWYNQRLDEDRFARMARGLLVLLSLYLLVTGAYDLWNASSTLSPSNS